MNEEEWLGCGDPHSLLRCVQRLAGRATPRRKQRLLLCGCCRLIWGLTPPPGTGEVVDVVEKYVDGQASLDEMNQARQAFRGGFNWRRGREPSSYLAARLTATANGLLWDAVHQATKLLIELRVNKALGRDEQSQGDWKEIAADWKRLEGKESLSLGSLVRDVFGNPFRPSPLDVWLSPTVLDLARAAYDERIMPSGELDGERLAVLSDALEEAGCDNEDILSHLRGPGPHVRGCWVVDVMLGKE